VVEAIAKRMAELALAINSQADAIDKLAKLSGKEWDPETREWKDLAGTIISPS
jgi:hypothetical protein